MANAQNTGRTGRQKSGRHGMLDAVVPPTRSMFKAAQRLLLTRIPTEMPVDPSLKSSPAKPGFLSLRKRKPKKEARKRQSIDLCQSEFELIRMKAMALDLKLNDYMRAKLLGEDYIEKPPSWLRDLLIKIYSELSTQGSNLNRLVRNVNVYSHSAEDALEMAERQRMPLFKAMQKLELALTAKNRQMIIKSSLRVGFKKTGRYLEDQGENEKTRLVLLSDPHVTSIADAFRAMWAIADGACVKKPIHHVSVNAMAYERMSDEQISRVCSLLESKYGYQKGAHQKVVVEHFKKGRQHFHIAWSRVSLRSGRPHYPLMHQFFSFIAARQIEKEFHLDPPVPRQGRSIELFIPRFHWRRKEPSCFIETDLEEGAPKKRKRKDGTGDQGTMGVHSSPFVLQNDSQLAGARVDFTAAAQILLRPSLPDRRQKHLAISADRRGLKA